MMRSLPLQIPSTYEFEYVKSVLVTSPEGHRFQRLIGRLDDGELVAVTIGVAMRGIEDAIVEASQGGFRVRVCILSRGTAQHKRSRYIDLDWAVGRYRKNEPPPRWSWARSFPPSGLPDDEVVAALKRVAQEAKAIKMTGTLLPKGSRLLEALDQLDEAFKKSEGE